MGRIRDRFRTKSGSAGSGLFEISHPKKVESRSVSRAGGLTVSTSFGVEKIHNKMFKIHKSNVYTKFDAKEAGESVKQTARSAIHSQKLEFPVGEFPH